MARIDPVEIPVNVSGPAVRIVALDRALTIAGRPSPGGSVERHAEDVVKVARTFEAYLSGGDSDDAR